MLSVSQKLNESIKRAGYITIKDCAQTLDLPYELLRKVVGEDHIPKDNQLLIYAKKLKIDSNELLMLAYYQKAPQEFKKYFTKQTAETPPVAFNNIPIIKWSEVKDFTFETPNHGKSSPRRHLSTVLSGEHLFALEIKDDSMKPLFVEGEIIIVDPVINPNHGNYVIAYLPDAIEPVLRLIKTIRNIRVLCPLNPAYNDIEATNEMRIVGRVIRKQKDF